MGELEQDARLRVRTPRRGLVLGAGGVLGGSWTIGALHALEEHIGWDSTGAELTVGTSVGSIIAALLTSGVSTAELLQDQYGQVVTGPLATAQFDHDGLVSSFRLLPPCTGSPELFLRSLLHPFSQSLLSWCAALSPTGHNSLDTVRQLVDHVTEAGEWPSALNIVATEYRTGNRRRFASSDSGRVPIAEAVAASCAVPGCFSPVTIDGRRYVDGSVSSITSTDLLTEAELDDVYILAPMTASKFDLPGTAAEWLERAARVTFNRALKRDVRKLEHAGLSVTVIAPCPDDLAAMGVDPMDTRRRIEVLETARSTTSRRFETSDQLDG